jgi:tRNA modification GTPase
VKHKESFFITNTRHKNALERAKKSIEEAIKAIHQGLSLEFVEIDVKNCWECLGEITGDTIEEDILDAIFSNFCIGK